MTDFVALKLLAVLSGGINGEPELHPRVTFPMVETRPQRLQELYGGCDTFFSHLEAYQKDVCPLGFYERLWVNNPENTGEGILAGYLTNTVSSAVDSFKTRADRLYRSNVNPMDQELVHLGLEGYALFQRCKRAILGQYQLAQGQFFGKLEGQDYLGALRLASRKTDLGFDRLRGHAVRFQAVDGAQLITPDDKTKIKRKMGLCLQQYEKELLFWWGRALGLRALYDLMHHIVDGCRVIQYQERTGILNQEESEGLRQTFDIHNDQWTLDSLYLELQAAFHAETCAARVGQGFMSRGMEYALNRVASFFARHKGAKNPRPFPSVVESAQRRIEEDYQQLKGYEENPLFPEQVRAQEFLEAVTKDHFLTAKQITLNGQYLEQPQYPWEKEQYRLDSFREVLTTLFRIQDEFFILKYKIAHRLKGGWDQALNEKFDLIDQAEYTVFQERILIKQAYQIDIKKQIEGMAKYWEQLKVSAVGGVKSYLLQGEVFAKTPSFEQVMQEVRGRIAIYCGYMREIKALLGEPDQAVVADMSSEPSPLKGKASPRALPIPSLQEASLAAVDEMAQKAYQRFYTPQDYYGLVVSDAFEKEERVGVAIVNCRDNIRLETEGWDWERELGELELYKNIFLQIKHLNERFNGVFRTFQCELIDSFRKKVLTDCSAYESFQSKTMYQISQTMLSQGVNSIWRKGTRLYQWKPVLNYAGNFRDPKFQLLFMQRLQRKQGGLSQKKRTEVFVERQEPLPEPPLLERVPVPDREIEGPKVQEERPVVKKIFTPGDYYNFVMGSNFEEDPHSARVIVTCHEEIVGEEIKWNWEQESQDLGIYCGFFSRINALMDIQGKLDLNTILALRTELLESFRKQVVTDHSAFVYSQPASLLGQGQNLLSLGLGSAWRKGWRAWEKGSLTNPAKNFRDQDFQTEFDRKLSVLETSHE